MLMATRISKLPCQERLTLVYVRQLRELTLGSLWYLRFAQTNALESQGHCCAFSSHHGASLRGTHREHISAAQSFRSCRLACGSIADPTTTILLVVGQSEEEAYKTWRAVIQAAMQGQGMRCIEPGWWDQHLHGYIRRALVACSLGKPSSARP
ncbi:uncharacterized protein EKO05_0010323 [Ascochyta rabiei]|uniref:uncharacterized protein n=1 Tax=Didymella rabiei TaxID=5454 RepID=UPI002209E06C|nr:uncharacterized protein EKO05_0010323 [Ascochyta rabiei]UPX20078.1 hypothetical protein EKO05_0010323 [Ascochyta rabiei]